MPTAGTQRILPVFVQAMKRLAVFATLCGSVAAILFLASAQPKLNISRSGADLSVSWSATNATNAVLQQTATPWVSNSWTSVTQTAVSNNDAFSVLISPTNGAAYFRLLSASGLVDEPDAAFVDSNGDGIDGDIARAIFVSASGSDTSAGTIAQPVRTLARGIALAAAGGKDVYVAAGTYTSGTLSLSNKVSIYGGYSPIDWSRNDAFVVNVNSTNSIAVLASEITNQTRLDHLTINGANASGTSVSAYGILLLNSSALSIRRCTIHAGNGATGTDGANAGINGGAGGNGTNGYNGYEDDSYIFCAGDVPDPPLTASGGASYLGGNSRGGDGKRGCRTGGANCAGISGEAGTTSGAPAGSGGFGISGGTGGSGKPGTNGVAGVNGAGGSGGLISGNSWVPNSGAYGGIGQAGGGGGGGAGGGSTHSTGTCQDWGGGGGGGGGGGSGGSGGDGGSGGGASFGVFLLNSVVIANLVTITTGNGGTGGAGRIGGPGGQAGTGGTAGAGYDEGRPGGAGGAGGKGGAGGAGGGGAGGYSVCVCSGTGSSWNDDGSSTLTPGSAGQGGTSAGNAGASGISAMVFP